MIVPVGDNQMTVPERLRWIRCHAFPTASEEQFDRSVAAVASAIEDNLQTEFPSPIGVPVVAGRLRGGNPVQVELRAFPHGARVGMMRGGNYPGNWMKPSLVGNLVDTGVGSALRYTFDARAKLAPCSGRPGRVLDSPRYHRR